MHTSHFDEVVASQLRGVPSANLWTADDLAAYLSLSRRAVYALVAGSTVPHIRIGARLRFQPQSVQAWVKAHACRSEATPSHDGRGSSTE